MIEYLQNCNREELSFIWFYLALTGVILSFIGGFLIAKDKYGMD